MRGVRNTVGRRLGRQAFDLEGPLRELDSRLEMIQALIPPGMKAVNELLQEEITRLASERYSRTGGMPGYARLGAHQRSVYLADQKVTVGYRGCGTRIATCRVCVRGCKAS